MKKEIGSYFWLNQEDLTISSEQIITPDMFGCKGENYIWLSTGRSAISLIINSIEQRNPNIKKTVCLPAFTCHTVLEPFLKANYDLIPLPMELTLHISQNTLSEYVAEYNPGIILLHSYFGFDTLNGFDQIISDVRKKEIVVIEDVTQCLYSKFPRLNADYYIGSIRKWCGMPDGAFAVSRVGDFVSKPIESDYILEKQKIEASLLKQKYIDESRGDKTLFLQKYKEAEITIASQNKIFKISPVSYKMQANLDVHNLTEKRINNYKLLLNEKRDNINVTPVFSQIDDNVTPLYFPVYCDKRNDFQQYLIKNDIYAPVVWPRSQCLHGFDRKTNSIYKNILCLPIDQRYDTDDMLRMVDIIQKFDS